MQSRLTLWFSSLPVLALYAATVLIEAPVGGCRRRSARCHPRPPTLGR